VQTIYIEKPGTGPSAIGPMVDPDSHKIHGVIILDDNALGRPNATPRDCAGGVGQGTDGSES